MSAIHTVQKFFPHVKKVTDAKTNTAIEVTSRDASSKAVRDHEACAMAVACKRKFNLDGVIISRSIAYLVKGNEAHRFKLPDSVSREVVSFDRGAGFAIGKYELAAMPKSARMGARQERTNGQVGGKNKTVIASKKRFRHITTGVRSVLGGQKAEE